MSGAAVAAAAPVTAPESSSSAPLAVLLRRKRVGLDERGRLAVAPHPGSPADAVRMRIVAVRLVIVDDMVDIVDMEAPCRHVGRDQVAEKAAPGKRGMALWCRRWGLPANR